MGRMGSLSGGQPYTEDSASEMAALLSSTSLPFLSTHPHFPTHLLSFLIFFLLPLSIYAEQQRITVKPEVTAYNVALPPSQPGQKCDCWWRRSYEVHSGKQVIIYIKVSALSSVSFSTPMPLRRTTTGWVACSG